MMTAAIDAPAFFNQDNVQSDDTIESYVPWASKGFESGVAATSGAWDGTEAADALTGVGDGAGDGCAAVPVPAGAPARISVAGVVAAGFSREGAVAAAGAAVGAGLGAAAGLGGAGFSGLMPPSQAGPVYISGVSPRAFHFSSKSAAALFGVSPLPITSFQG